MNSLLKINDSRVRENRVRSWSNVPRTIMKDRVNATHSTAPFLTSSSSFGRPFGSLGTLHLASSLAATYIKCHGKWSNKTGWWLSLPLLRIWVRHLEWLNSQYIGTSNACSTSPTRKWWTNVWPIEQHMEHWWVVPWRNTEQCWFNHVKPSKMVDHKLRL